MSTALAKAHAENTALKERNSKSRMKLSRKQRGQMEMAAGVFGGSVSAAGTGIIDARFAKPGKDVATFGESDVPVAPVVGLLIAVGSLALVKTNPSAAAFLGYGGLTAMNIGIYNMTRDKMDEIYADTETKVPPA